MKCDNKQSEVPGLYQCSKCGCYYLRLNDGKKCHEKPKRTKVTRQCDRLGVFTGNLKTACNDGVFHPTNDCTAHNRCLPHYNPTGKQLTAWLERPESKMYHLCNGCTDFNPKEQNE